MNYELTIMPGTRIVLFRWSGPITLKDRKRNLERVLQFCRENGIGQVIVDTRQQVNKTTTMQMFAFAATLPKAAPWFHIAIVRHPFDEEIKFGENVAANRGAIVRSFVTLEEAQRWLETKDAGPISKRDFEQIEAWLKAFGQHD